MEARGFEPERLIEGVQCGTMDLAGEWTMEANKVLVF